jgi:hypothetical protein
VNRDSLAEVHSRRTSGIAIHFAAGGVILVLGCIQLIQAIRVRLAASAAFTVATCFLLVGTYYFAKFYWGPAILHRLTG